MDAARAHDERETRRVRRANRRLRALLTGAAGLLALAAVAAALFLDQRETARARARAADAQRLGVQALIDPQLDRWPPLGRQGAELEPHSADQEQSPRRAAGLGAIALLPDGRVLLVGDNHGHVTFLDTATGSRSPPDYGPEPSYIRQLLFNTDSSRWSSEPSGGSISSKAKPQGQAACGALIARQPAPAPRPQQARRGC